MRRFFVLAIVLLTGLGLSCMGCSRQSEGKRPPAAVPVIAGSAVKQTIPVEINAIGTASPFSAISVRSKVAGEITHVHFREGQDVKKGDALFKIDCRDLMATLRQAEANLAKDIAVSRNAEEDAARYKTLVEKGYIAKQQYDQARTNATSTAGVVEADRALVENIKVRLSYCSISSPISGRTGNLMVDRGNLVKENDAVLVTINQITPIYVGFTVPEKYLSEIKRFSAGNALKVHAYIPDDPQPEEGILTFIDNTVDKATGTIALKATFQNKSKRLWPGQFLNVAVTLAERSAVLVPSRAVLSGQDGTYVFVIKPDNTVQIRLVETSGTYKENSIIDKGLEAGEHVVLDGQVRLTQGTRITVKGSPHANTTNR